MDILICTAKDEDVWRATLAQRMPEARVHADIDAPACDYAVLWQPPATLFERQPRLRAMFSLGAGVNGLLAMTSLPRHVPLVRMEDAGMAEQMVEYALYVTLRQFRRFRDYGRLQREHRWAPQPMRARREFTVGILGLGVLGGAAARALADFGFDVAGWSTGLRVIDGVRCESGPAGLDAVLCRSDLVMLFLPLTDATRGLIDDRRLARLPEGATLVNLARGELIDEAALLRALDTGRLEAACLDVFQHEPLPQDHAFWRHPRVEITPHIAALTDIGAACDQIAAKIRRFEEGAIVSGVVDRSRGY